MPAPRVEGSEGVDRRTFLAGVAATGIGLSLARPPGGWPSAEAADAPAPAAPAAAVKQGVLGRTKLPVSRVVFGGGGLRPEDSRLLQVAYDHGINAVDVAWGYGNGQAELAVGGFLKGFKDREKVFVSTKASGFRPPEGTTKEVYAALEAALRQSLGRMGTEYVDVFMWPHGASDPGFLRDQRMREAMSLLRERKLVRHLGFSSHANYVKTCSAAVEDGTYDVILTVINVCTQNADKAGAGAGGRSPEDTRDLVKAAQKKGVGLLAMKVANPGYLTAAADGLLAQEFPAESPLTRHQKLYAYGLRQDGVCAVVAGLRSAQHLQQAVQVGAA